MTSISPAEKFHQQYPEAYFLSLDDIPALENYLRERKWLKAEEAIKSVSKAGEGNINLVIRVDTGKRTFIIKQARPWVEKYPHIAAPVQRNIIEGKFYSLIQEDETMLAGTPSIIGRDETSFILVMNDLGNSNDLTDLYQKDVFIEEGDLKTLTRFLTVLHSSFRAETCPERISNDDMRKLNYQHLFVYPLAADNGFNLDTLQKGLQELSVPYKSDEAYKEKVRKLGEIYLAEGDTLLHGDYFPGSWLKTVSGIKIIDPEFCFFGPAEFDLAVFIAHMKIARQPEGCVSMILNDYKGKDKLDLQLLANFTGVEIMRRLIGLAQLPLRLKLDTKKKLLHEAYDLIMDPMAALMKP